MKSQLSCILFALVAACGDSSTPSATRVSSLPPAPVTPAPKVETPTPKVEEAHPLPTKYSEAMTDGKALAAKGDHARARELFEAAIKLDKKRAEPHIELARLFISTGERGPAVIAANKAVKLAPESSQAWNTLGRAELARFNYDGAITAFRQSTELNADNVWAWNNLGFAHLALKQYKEAIDALVEATSRKGAEGYMWNNLGTAYEQLDQLDDARTAFDKGGALGSKEAVASRKRLEGVKTTVVIKDTKLDTKDDKADKPAKGEKTYEIREPSPEESTKPEGEDAGVEAKPL